MQFEIICVDDEKDMLELLQHTFEADFGYKAVCFEAPNEAMKYISQNDKKISLIISDFNMGDIDGFQFRQMTLEDHSHIPFVIITGFYDKEQAIKAMELSVQAFLDKPYEKSVLRDVITKFAKPREESLRDEREMIEGFLTESSPMLENIEDLILELEEDPSNPQTLPTYFRLLHTIKGTASCVGLQNMGSYTHKYEDFVGELRDGKIQLTPESIDVLLKGLDGLKEVFAVAETDLSDNRFQADEYLEIFEKRDFKAAEKGHLKFNEGKVETKQDKPKAQAAPQNQGGQEDEKMSVSMTTLDEFMEESGELTVLRNTISKTVKSIEMRYRGDSELDILNDLLGGLYKVTSNIQNKIVELRKVKLGKVFRPFKRLVRDISKSLDKKVEMEIIGEEIAVDNILAKVFSNTFIHLIRNSLDHGIEIPEKRVECGKPEVGTVKINIAENGDEIHIDITDDGKGIDPTIIKKIALSKGLYQEAELDAMTDIDVVNIIFDSGFSTAEVVSDLSGRGVGMDMVKSTIENHGGSIHVESEMGVGSTFKIKIPIPKSVLIVETLQVQCVDETLKISMDEVVEVLRVTPESSHTKIHATGGGLSLEHHKQLMPLLNLGTILGKDECKYDDELTNVVVVKFKTTLFALIVDEINDFEEVVCKKIPQLIQSHALYSGASILGNGHVAMILSAEGIMSKCAISEKTKKRRSASLRNENEEKTFSQYLLFDSIEKQVFGINLNDVQRLEKVEKSKITKTGDRCIINYNGRALLLVDPIKHMELSKTSVLHSDVSEINFIVVKKGDSMIGIVIREVQDIIDSCEDLNKDTTNINGLDGSLYLKEKTTNIIDVDYFFDFYFKKQAAVNVAA